MPSKFRPRPPAHPKRKTIALVDGWSVITSSRPNPVPKHTTPDPYLDPEADYSPPSPERVASTIAEVNIYLERWRTSKCATDLGQILRRRKKRGDDDIVNAICAGLGSLNTESLTQRKTRMWQFVVFLWLVEQVQGQDCVGVKEREIKCYAQEPRFTPTDILVLEHFGIVALPELNGKEMVNERTLLYAPFLPWSLLLKDFLQSGTPAVCVATDIRESVEMLQMRIKYGTQSIDSEGVLLRDEDLKDCERVGRGFLERKTGVAFPVFEFHNECLKLMVYIGKEQLETG